MSMKAAYVEQVGPPENLIYGDQPEPEPGPNDIKIRVRATSLNRLDVFMREGSHGTRITPPEILGRDICGEVVAVGREVQGFQSGERVVASGAGSYAEYALAPGERTFHLPDTCSFDDGGALPTAGLTAYQMVINRAGVRPGDDVLVMAAGSGVSSYAIQIAHAVGGRVIATAERDDKLVQAREIGADEVINHYTEDIAARVLDLTQGQGVDVVIEHVGAAVWPACFRSLKVGGRFVTCGVTVGHRVDLHLGLVFTRALNIMGVGRGSPDDMRALIKLVALGRVRSVIHQRFPLSEAVEAHRLLENSNFFGKVVLNP
ncbi:alcohol dehydrogenase [Candidatus Entotheonella serta]|nr:alcohol dehydrogenase [Candidatus Entotheonella serta]